jgi:hypothetical protein
MSVRCDFPGDFLRVTDTVLAAVGVELNNLLRQLLVQQVNLLVPRPGLAHVRTWG